MSVLLEMAQRRSRPQSRLRQFGLPEAGHRKRFDDLTNLAVTLTQMPVAFIAVEEAGQWHMRSQRGLGSGFIDDLLPMCRYVQAQQDLVLVTRSNDTAVPVAGFWPVALEMQFAAMVPLLDSEGQTLGCLGVLDGVARILTTEQQVGLWALGRQAVTQLELRRSLTKLARANADKSRAEQAAAAERNLLRAVIDSVPDNLYLKDTAGRYILDNIAHVRFLGAAKSDAVLGKTVFDFFPLEQAQKFDADDKNVLRWGEALLNIDEVALDQAGMRHNLLTSKIPLRDEHGSVIGLICVSHDVTGRKQIDVAAAQLAVIVENSTDAIYSKGLDGIIHTWNAAAERLYGYTAAEIIGRHVSVLAPPECTDEMQRIHQQLLLGWRLPTFETERVRQDGSRVEVSMTVSPLRDTTGTVVGASVIARDISDRRQKARELEAMNRRLSETLRDLHRTQHELIQTERLKALGEMAGSIAHDFNNALAPIMGFSELLLTRPADAGDPGKRSRYLEAIHDRAAAATHIVDRLRDFYRFREDSEALRPMDLNRVVREALDLVQPRLETEAPAAGVTIHVESALEVVPVVALLVAEVREAITNLLHNAIDALIRKGQPGTLRLVTRLDGDHVLLDVIDTGVGMDDETRRRCLEPFFTTKTNHGSGLGLAMVYGMVQRHNGQLTIDSTAGAGTTVCLRFPVPTKREINGFTIDAGQPACPLRMLIVDDEPDVREVSAEFLKEDGHQIDTAASGPEALEKFQAGHYDLVITDRAMPEMTGDQLAEAIKQLNPDTRIILLTGFGDMMNAAGEKPTGVDLVLGKPISMVELRQTVAKVAKS